MERRFSSHFTLIFLAIILFSCVGCIGAAAQLMYFFQGLKVKAEYDGLKNSRVAVICVTDASSYGPNNLTKTIGQILGSRLQIEVNRIQVIPQNEIENWKDINGWNEIDFVQIGKGLKADKVLAVEIDSYSIHEGQTMYKGRAMVTTKVYDIKNGGEVVFSQGPAEYQFPKSHGRPALATDEQQFERVYLSKLVEKIAHSFYDYERVDEIADDAAQFEY